MNIEIVGIAISSIIAIGIAIYQVKASNKRKKVGADYQNRIWKHYEQMQHFIRFELIETSNKTGVLNADLLTHLIKNIQLEKVNMSGNEYENHMKF